MTEEELKTAEQLIRIGAKAISADKSLEETQQITGTALHVISKMRDACAVKTEQVTDPRSLATTDAPVVPLSE